MTDFIAIIGDIDYHNVTISEGELYRQALLEKGNSPATIIKKMKSLKHLFQLAVDREQLQHNPVKRVKTPKAPKKKVEIYTNEECCRMIMAAGQMKCSLKWDILIALAIETGMRKSELLNLTLRDIDFERVCIDVSPKRDTKETWRWDIKDVDCRTIPITKQMLALLAEFQLKRPSGYPYVFIPAARYDYIQNLRSRGKPAPTGRNKLITNFSRTFKRILKKANIRHRQFHDLRSTAITNWLYNGLKEHEVMRLAGHSSFETTHRFYLAVQPDLYQRARRANAVSIGDGLAHIWRAP